MRLGFSPLTAMMLDTEAGFRLAAELELSFVELTFDLHEVMPALQDARRMQELTRATGVGTTLHMSFVDLNLASLIPAARQSAVERTQRGLAYAAEVGATCAVLHTGQHYLKHPRVDPLVAAALDASLRAIAGSGVEIVLENLVLNELDVLRTPEELRDLTDRHGFRNCLDFGHAHVQGTRDGWPALEGYLDTLGERITHLHLHGNHGGSDEHLATHTGTLDYAPYAGYLRDFAGTICLEIGPEAAAADGVRSSVRHLRELVAGPA
jgi:sugar phosphate isomerase/epimerase